MSTVISAFQERNQELSRRLHQSGEPVEEAHFSRRRQRTYYKGSLGYVLSLGWAITLSYLNNGSLSYLQIWVVNFLGGLLIYLGMCLHYYLRLTYYNYEYARESWEMENYPTGEINEMIELYVNRHLFQQLDAETIITTMAKYPKFFINHMMSVELDMSNSNLCPPYREALYPTISFWVYSGLFTLPYVSHRFQRYALEYLIGQQTLWWSVIYYTYLAPQHNRWLLRIGWIFLIAMTVTVWLA